MYFESSPGSDVLDVTDIAYQVACTNDNGATAGYQFLAGVFGDGTSMTMMSTLLTQKIPWGQQMTEGC